MKIIDKYLLRECLQSVFYCLFGFIMIAVIVDLLGELSEFIEAELPIYYILKYYVCYMGEMIDYLLPASLLFATLYCLFRMTHSNELMAIRSSGMSFYRMMMPFVMTGLVVSLIMVALRVTVIPGGLQWAENLKDNDFHLNTSNTRSDVTYYNTREHRIWKIGTYIRASQTNHTTIYNLQLRTERPDGTRKWIMDADKAQFLDNEWWFFSVQSIIYYDEDDNPVENLSNPFSVDESHLMRISELNETPEDINIDKSNWNYMTIKERYRYLHNHPYLTDINSRLYDIYDVFSFPFACLIVILFAIPTGAKTARSNPLSTIFIAILAFFGYYILYLLSEYLCRRGLLPPLLAAWLANLVFLVIGGYMTVKMH